MNLDTLRKSIIDGVEGRVEPTIMSTYNYQGMKNRALECVEILNKKDLLPSGAYVTADCIYLTLKSETHFICISASEPHHVILSSSDEVDYLDNDNLVELVRKLHM